jgi:hypothetical protein
MPPQTPRIIRGGGSGGTRGSWAIGVTRRDSDA